MAKVLSHSSTNPKMTIGKTPVKGYAAGGQVVDTRPVTQKSRTVYVDEKGLAGPKGTAYSAPVSKQMGRAGMKVVTTPREETWSEYGEGLVYSPYDTSMEEPAKAPTVGYGEAPKITAMPEIAKPGDVQYYGESKKAEAAKFNEERYAAYNRRVENAAIRSGNAMPGAAAPKEVYSITPSLTPKSVQLALPKASERAEIAPVKITTDSLVAAASMLTPKGKVLFKSADIGLSMDEAVKRRKKQGEV